MVAGDVVAGAVVFAGAVVIAGAVVVAGAVVLVEVPQLVKIVINTNNIARETVNLFISLLIPSFYFFIEEVFLTVMKSECIVTFNDV